MVYFSFAYQKKSVIFAPIKWELWNVYPVWLLYGYSFFQPYPVSCKTIACFVAKTMWLKVDVPVRMKVLAATVAVLLFCIAILVQDVPGRNCFSSLLFRFLPWVVNWKLIMTIVFLCGRRVLYGSRHSYSWFDKSLCEHGKMFAEVLGAESFR